MAPIPPLQRAQFRRLHVLIIAANLALLAINIAFALGWRGPIHEFYRQLDLTDEGNMAVWFSSMQLF
jgi:hypothetical protein